MAAWPNGKALDYDWRIGIKRLQVRSLPWSKKGFISFGFSLALFYFLRFPMNALLLFPCALNPLV
jgi:hypothetical protein